ncbi:MAG: tRNA (adenine(22)-N(1))-methyltransferase [Roseburia sp.]
MMRGKISKRLEAVMSLVSAGNVLADIGTDHGYVPITLVEQGRIPRAIAMDINRGPLERAKENIAAGGMDAYIETRLSDGVAALRPGEADTILLAGMGGGLMIHILKEGREVCMSAKELVLQPQSELSVLRHFLAESGYLTEQEDMVEEDGKYYPMMRVRYASKEGRMEPELFALYGRGLLTGRHPVLYAFLRRENEIYRELFKNLEKRPQTEAILQRRQEVEAALEKNREALDYYEKEKGIWEKEW